MYGKCIPLLTTFLWLLAQSISWTATAQQPPANFQFTPTNQSGVFQGQATFNGDPLTENDWIAAFDEDGNCAGAVALIENGGSAFINLTIYGDDPNSGADEGMSGNEDFTLQLYHAATDAYYVYPDNTNPTTFSGWENTNGAPINGYNDPSVMYLFGDGNQGYCVPEYPANRCTSPNDTEGDRGAINAFIRSFELGSISNKYTHFSFDDLGYSDYTNLSTDLVCDVKDTLYLQINTCGWTNFEFAAWIDFNQNGVFESNEEKIFDSNIDEVLIDCVVKLKHLEGSRWNPNDTCIIDYNPPASCTEEDFSSGTACYGFFHGHVCRDGSYRMDWHTYYTFALPICLPPSVQCGETRLRVTTTYYQDTNNQNVTYQNFDPCSTNYDKGETEDYTVNIRKAYVEEDAVTICRGSSAQLNVIGGTSYEWFPQEGLDDPTSANPIATPEYSTYYGVIITYADGTQTTTGVDVTVIPETGVIFGQRALDSNDPVGNSMSPYFIDPNPSSIYSWTLAPTNAAVSVTVDPTTNPTDNKIFINWRNEADWATDGIQQCTLTVTETMPNGCIGTSATLIRYRTANDPFPICNNDPDRSQFSTRIYGQACIGFDGQLVGKNDWIAACNSMGEIVGSNQIQSDVFAGEDLIYFNLQIYGEDQSTACNEMQNGELFTLKLYHEELDLYLDFPNSETPTQFCMPSGAYVGQSSTIECQSNVSCTSLIDLDNPSPINNGEINYCDFETKYIFELPPSDLIPLKQGWNLIAIDVIPDDLNIPSVFEDLIAAGELIAVSGFRTQANGGGTLYLPSRPPFLNSLTEIEPGFAYWVKVTTDTELRVFGTPIDHNFKEELQVGWNLRGYTRQPTPPACEDVITYFDALLPPDPNTNNDPNILEIVTSYNPFEPDPNDYVRLFSYANIANGRPFRNNLTEVCNSFGYWIRINNNGGGTIAGTDWKIAPSAKSKVQVTNNYMFIHGTSNLPTSFAGQTIQVYTQDKILCGEMTVLDNGYLMTTPIYGDDATTEQIEGAIDGERLRFVLNGQPLPIKVRFEGNMELRVIDLRIPAMDMVQAVDQLAQKQIDVLSDVRILPNPFNQQTTIQYELATDTEVEVVVYDITGKQVATLVQAAQTAGKYTVEWIPQSLSSGTYFLHILTNQQTYKVQKLILTK